MINIVLTITAVLLNCVAVPFAIEVFSRPFGLREHLPLLAQSILGLATNGALVLHLRHRPAVAGNLMLLLALQTATVLTFVIGIASWPVKETAELFFTLQAFGPSFGVAAITVASLVLLAAERTPTTRVGVIRALSLVLYVAGLYLCLREALSWAHILLQR